MSVLLHSHFEWYNFSNQITSVYRYSAQNKSDNNPNKSGTRTLGNQVIRKGNLCIQNLGIMKGKMKQNELNLF